jgi:predicted ATPase
MYSAYGLTSDFKVESFVESINRSRNSKQRLQIIKQVLLPFMEGNAARLQALTEIQSTIKVFVDGLNSFYRNKHATFHLRGGLKVISEATNHRIPVRKLSSGEQELLLLFCNILVSRHNNTIFIIDEPELSLNVTWQRQLVRALLRLSANSQVQFLMATHSIELLTQYGSAVLPLTTASNVHEGN